MTLNAIQPDALFQQGLTVLFLTDTNSAKVAQLLPADLKEAFQLDEAHSESGKEQYYFNGPKQVIMRGLGKQEKLQPEGVRKAIHAAVGTANKHKQETMNLALVGMSSLSPEDAHPFAMALGETSTLSNYAFKPYQKEPELPTLVTTNVHTDLQGAEATMPQAAKVARATCHARDLVNEPPNVLTPTELANRATALGKEYGFSTEVWDKKRLQAEGWGGLLSVNLGSVEPPVFIQMEWKPAKPVNSKPVVLVGKGVTFDTGGLNLKPGTAMDTMKSDMGGAASVIGAITALAATNTPVHVIALVPSTDNRPGQEAYTPNDVIDTLSGYKVEILNTDAEGRVILCDALHYAKSLEPELVIDFATLTGAAVIAVGPFATAFMGTADDSVKQALSRAGFATYERLAELPIWDEYDELLKSDIADFKNVGSRAGGAITAGKFLQKFTDYPWVHIDIAPTAYNENGPDGYRPKGGTGVGVRLMAEFFRTYGQP